MESDDLEYILDHYKNPRNYGTIDDPDLSFEEGIPSCGDLIRLDLKLEGRKVKEVKFSGTGCAISQASVSILTEQVCGKEIEQVKLMSDQDMLNALGSRISPIRFNCALLGLKVLQKALSDNNIT